MKYYLELTDFILCSEISNNFLMDSVTLNATDGKYFYAKHVSSDEFSRMAGESGLEDKVFKSDTRTALADKHDDSIDDASFHVQVDKDITQATVTVSWKKTTSGVKFLLGSTTLNRVENAESCIFEMMRDLVKNKRELSKRCLLIETEYDRFKVERNQALQLLEESAKAKKLYETEMLDKFCQVLNEKKRKIRELTETIDDMSNSTSSSGVAKNEEEANDTDTEKEVIESLRLENSVKSGDKEKDDDHQELFVPRRKPRGKGRKQNIGANAETDEPVKVRKTRSSPRNSLNNDSLLDKLA